MDRIRRLGQRRPVQAIKLVVEDSIEPRIVQVIVPRSHCDCPADLRKAAREEIRDGRCNIISG